MKNRISMLLAVFAIALGGCVTAPQLPVQISKDSLASKTTKVGVAMTPLPKVDTQFPGAGCLLCIAAASVANQSLTNHIQTLSYEDLPELKNEMAKLLRNTGVETKVIDEPLTLDKLPSFSSKEPNFARQDYSSLKAKYDVDKLLVINITALGAWRQYANYFPTEDPKAVFSGTGYMVNLSNNALEWYLPVDVRKGSDQNWDEPPKFPGLTNAYFIAIETGKDALTKPFTK